MVVERLVNCERYSVLHPLFHEAFQYLLEFNAKETPPGRHDINGDKLFAIVSEYNGIFPGTLLEAHRRYIDIHYVYEGEDTVGWKDLQDCNDVGQAFDSEKDVVLFNDTPDLKFGLKEGFFAILYPNDAHAPLMGEGQLRKIVIKIEI